MNAFFDGPGGFLCVVLTPVLLLAGRDCNNADETRRLQFMTACMHSQAPLTCKSAWSQR